MRDTYIARTIQGSKLDIAKDTRISWKVGQDGTASLEAWATPFAAKATSLSLNVEEGYLSKNSKRSRDRWVHRKATIDLTRDEALALRDFITEKFDPQIIICAECGFQQLKTAERPNCQDQSCGASLKNASLLERENASC